jgi:LysR family transcriptional activator of nhaA
MIPINYHHLYYFYVIAKAGTINKACKTLLLAQSTVSAQLKQFEAALGRRLFERKKQRLYLTEDGRLVLDYAESIFEMGQELLDALGDRPETGRIGIQVGISNASSRVFGQALLECILKESPTASVTVLEGGLRELLSGLREQTLDVVLSDVSLRSQDQDELSNHLVGKVPIVLAAAPHLSRRYRKIPRDLDGAPFILPSASSQVHHQIQDALARWKVRPKVVAEVQDAESARRLALAGHGIAPLTACTLSASLPAKGLGVIGSEHSLGVCESVYLVTRRRKWPHPLVGRLIKDYRLPRSGQSRGASRRSTIPS